MASILRLSILTLALALAAPADAARADWQQQVAEALGRTGTDTPDGIYRVGLPRTDLAVKLDGVAVKPALALGSWLAFKPEHDGTVMVMGDLVLTGDEVNPVMKALVESGLEITALHNHLLRSEPATMYMHVSGHGDPARLASTLRKALALSKTPFGPPAASPASAGDTIDLDTAAIEQALGHKGKVNGGVYQTSIARAEPVRDDGMKVPEAMGSGIVINFQPTGGGRAAVTGDFVLIASEVQPVLKALRAHGIEVTALHNHMLNDEPRMFFMHFWANDDVRNLAQGLKTALAAVNIAKR